MTKMINKKYFIQKISERPKENGWIFFVLRISAYAALSASLLGVGWHAWPDIIVDFGQELYIPWQITQGAVVYRDIDFFHQGGPLSQYWNALWFYIFGPSLNTILIVNLLTLVLLIFLLEKWLRSLTDTLSAFVAMLFFLAVFAFNRYTFIGNYNYIAPYSISLVHGLLIILSILILLRSWAVQDKPWKLWASGFLLGLALLNKIEVAFTAIIVSSIYIISVFYTEPKRISKNVIFVLFLAILSPPIITLLAYSRVMPLGEAAYGIFNQWVMLVDGRLSKFAGSQFYRNILGADDILKNILKMTTWTLTYLSTLALVLLIELGLAKKTWRRPIVFISTLALFFGISFLFIPNWAWVDSLSPLPLILGVGGLLMIRRVINERREIGADSLLLFGIVSFIFAGTFLSKMLFNIKIYHYGFILVMPATLLLVAVCFKKIPAYVEKYLKIGKDKSILRAAFLGLLLAFSITYIQSSSKTYDYNSYRCCNGREDFIMTDPIRGPIIDATLSKLTEILKPNETFTVIPEGTMLNYMLKRKNPTPYYQFLPQLFTMYDERDIIQKVSEDPPDYFVIAHSDNSESGLRYLGTNFGVEFYDWVLSNYKIIWLAGEPPLQPGTYYGMAIAEKIKRSEP